MKKSKVFILLAASAVSTWLASVSDVKAATLVSFPSTPTPENVPIPRGSLNPFTGGRGWGFSRGQTFSFVTQWANFGTQTERVTLDFIIAEIDTLFNDRFKRSVSFILPAGVATNIQISTTLSAGELNSACEPAACNTRFGVGFFGESGRLEFQLESPTFTAEPVTVLEPTSTLGLLALGTLGAGSALLRKKQQVKLTENSTDKAA